jgi:hypothetical protein
MPEKLLQKGDSVTVAAQDRFIARDHFAADLGPKAKVRIAYVMGNFNRWFLGKVEEPAPEVSLVWFELQRNAGDQIILAELGGGSRVETTLSALFALMARQHAGQAGPLANNGWGNAFYVRDVAGELRSVYIHWCDEGWGVDAEPIVRATEWPIRDRVFAPLAVSPI